MLRASFRSSTVIGYKPNAARTGRQWDALRAARMTSGGMVRALTEFLAVN
jgi:hypothetical protein